MRLADHAMQLLDNGRQIALRSGGCGTYVAASLRLVLRRCPCGDRSCPPVPIPSVEAEAEGATPSEAIYALVRGALNRAARRHRKRKEKGA